MYHKIIYISISLIITCNIICLPVINQLHIAHHHACQHHIHHSKTDAYDNHNKHRQTDDNHDASNTFCPFCLQLHALTNTMIIDAFQNSTLLFLQCLKCIHIDYDDLVQFPFVILTNQRSPPFI